MYLSSRSIYMPLFRVLCVILFVQAAKATVSEERSVCTVTCGNALSCCGASCYDPARYVCREGNLLCPVLNGIAGLVCGRGCYDPASYSCCDGALVQGLACSGSTPTATPTAAPTAGPTAAPTQTPTSAPSQPLCSVVCSSGLSCCGSSCFLPSQYVCRVGNMLCPVLNGISWDVCGSSGCYDTSKYSCCDGKLQQGACSGASVSSGATAAPTVSPAAAPTSAPTYAPISAPSSSSIRCAAWNEARPKPTRTLTFINQCDQDIWVGAEGSPIPMNGGWALPMGQTSSITVPETFRSGRFWPRTGCRWTGGKFVCQTGDCDGRFECAGKGGSTPVTLIEFTMAPDIDYYDMSLVDGYSISAEVYPVTDQCQQVNNIHLGRFNCGRAFCKMNTRQCPPELQISDAHNHTYCLSICAAVHMESQRSKFPMLQSIYNNADERSKVCCACDCGDNCGCESPHSKYCCSPHNSDGNSPNELGGRCYVESWPLPSAGNWPSRYDQVFKSQCPDAYSWQFDDFASTFQCRNADYVIKFCPYNNA